MAVQDRSRRETGIYCGCRRGSGIFERRPPHPGAAFSGGAAGRLDRPDPGIRRMAPNSHSPAVSSGAILFREELLETAVDAAAWGSRDVLFPTGGVERVAEPDLK